MVTQANQLGPGVGTLMVVTSVREPRDPMAVPMVSPVPMQMVSPVPMQALATGMSPAPAGCEPTGGNQVMMYPAARAMEEIRQRVMREAEEAFAIPVSFQWSWSWCRDWTDHGCCSAYGRRP